MYKKTRPGRPEPCIIPHIVEFKFVNPYRDDALLREMANWCVANVGDLMHNWRISHEEFSSSYMGTGGSSWQRSYQYLAHKKLFHFENEADALAFKLAWSEYLQRTKAPE